MMKYCHGCQDQIGINFDEECFINGAVGFCTRACALRWGLDLPVTDPAWQQVSVTPTQTQDELPDPHFQITGSL